MSRTAPFDALFVELQLALAGRYSLDHELGRGGMGVVYLARDVQLDRSVAIKVLPPERGYDEEVRERFVREARLAAKLSHPNIVPIHAVDEAGPFVFYVMSYVNGETLGERVRTRGPLPPHEATRILREVAWALGHAHAQGVVHRDVKPENILLENGTGRALVTDFGIAAAIGSDDDGPVTGTPEYMSPEQALGHAVDARSDIYALGAMAFFVCTGRPPFAGDRAVDVLAHQVATPAPAVTADGARVPRRLAHLIEKCLTKAPSDRPQSALALAEQLGAAVEERREVPAALRAFVKRDGRVLSSGGVLLVGYFGLMGLVSIGFAAGVLAAVATTAALALTPVAAMVWAARKLLRRGYEHADLRVAFEHDIEQLREEFHATGLREARGVERAATSVAVASLVGLVALTTVRVAFPTAALWIQSWAGPLLGVGVFGGMVVRLALRSRRPYAASEGWAKIWLGKIGRGVFALARRLGGRPAHGAATTHRATELAIGMAATELFASLPRDTRRALGDVPRIIGSLQRDAELLREQHQRLQKALDDAGDVATGQEYADVRAMRDELGERHREVVSTLERLRLDLLRLHAGAVSVDGVTTQVGLAGDVAQEVRRLLEARGDVERFLAR
ncbi:MAG: serine/threonine protein kinase [Gemmatimonadetes bacterium]|nr:serine/threonine protein kinase [Gemmatimonadota bacterium]